MMSLSLDDTNSTYQIKSYQDGIVNVNDQMHKSSLILSPTTLLLEWPLVDIHKLQEQHLTPIFDLEPDIILLGTGQDSHFPSPEILEPLIKHKIGYEIMSTPSACRTFNVLCAEGRHVVAGLII